ncbi:MAG TPA: cytochrome c oxidase subunit 3 [Pyrinomonadaceae bacterium]|nr:cytochrome c oxidase subunit 3 [Pyrinomonadaceae bacterium]
MEIGTAEIVDEIDGIRRARPGRLSGSGPAGNGGGRNPGGGGDGPDDDPPTDATRFVPEKSRVLTAFLLLVVLMTFGGLSAAYIVIATNNAVEWRPFSLPIQVWVSTALILLSSITFHLGKTSVMRDDQPRAKKWFIVTTALGAAFISSQILAWFELVSRGLYVKGNSYIGFFYILTAVHAVHVVGGIIALGSILLRVWYPTANAGADLKRRTLAQVVGWYWHFMAGIWLALFVLLGFWK